MITNNMLHFSHKIERKRIILKKIEEYRKKRLLNLPSRKLFISIISTKHFQYQYPWVIIYHICGTLYLKSLSSLGPCFLK